ncbi:DNA primase [Mycobacterium phage Marcoliusprime]|nr:DNA primase [Mycobacterium phage Marcoliusprime]AYB69026.1 DNA primase [Mycobacterium phage DismalStressor]
MKFSELLDMLGYTEGEYLSLCHQVPGHNFMANVVEFDDRTPAKALRYVDDCDLWFGVNPTRRRGDDEGGRGKAEDVTRLAAVWCDLDVKPGACRDLAHARQIIDELSAIVGTRPSAVVMSGHGLQPYWPIDDGQLANGDDDPTMQAASEELRAEAAAVLKRWGRLAVMVAEHQGAKIDRGVYDLSRVLRVPGSYNRKGEPVLVTCEADNGAPLTIDELAERLDEAGVHEHEGDRRTALGEVVSAPDSWEPAAAVCDYFAQTIKAWRDEPITERHNWLVRQAVRIMCGLRNGCLTAGQLDEARKAVVERFESECAKTKRPIPAWEIRSAFAWARDHAARMTDAELATEMGSHLHLWEKAEPRPVILAAQPSEQTAGKSADPQVNPENGEATANVTLTDTGNADLLVGAWGKRLVWCPEAGKWFAWEGTRWRSSTDGGEAMRAAREVVEAIKCVEGDKDTAKHKMRSLGRRALENMVALAKTDPRMRVGLGDLDAEPYALNTPSGIVDLRTGELTPHRPEGWHTKVTGCGYDPLAAAPTWRGFLFRTFGGDAELVGYVQRLAGLAATGNVTHHVLPFLFGGGSNGKSVLMDVLAAVLGDYAISAPANFLLAGRDRHETEIARLHGARLVVCSEINADSKFDEAKVKVLTGGDVLSGRYMRQDFFDFTPTHTLFLMGNHRPQVTAGGTSFWRRLRLIPFDHEVPKDQRNPRLAAELVRDEGAAILAWIVEGARQVAASGLDEPESVLKATEEYSDEEDALKRFITECCDLGVTGASTKPTLLMNAFVNWAAANGEATEGMTVVKLGRELAARFNVRVSKSNGARVYRTLRVREEWIPQFMRNRGIA